MGGKNPSSVQLHGSAMEVICTQCSFTENVYHHFLTLRKGELPSCLQCKKQIGERNIKGKRSSGKCGFLRPAVILYRESHPKEEDIRELQAIDEKRANCLLVVGTSLKTFGSVDLIKKLSDNLRKNKRGQVYYMDLENPSKSLEEVFDHIVQTDCQNFANYMLREFYKAPSISLTSFNGEDNLKDWVDAGTICNDLRPSWAWV